MVNSPEAADLKQRAAECRALAEAEADPAIRENLLKQAASLEADVRASTAALDPGQPFEPEWRRGG
jgi:hypothetical protein